MKILVGYKRVVDANVRIQVRPDGSGVVTEGVKLSPNPFDDIALEEALRLRDQGIATEVIVTTIAPADAQPHLRNGLAMGANRAIHIVSDGPVSPLTAARTLLKLVEKEQPGFKQGLAQRTLALVAFPQGFVDVIAHDGLGWLADGSR